jgi:hypothetical protein
MKKTQLNVRILKTGSENKNLLQIIAACNEGLVKISLEDLISYGICQQALYPGANKNTYIERMSDDEAEEDYNCLRVTEDNGKSWTLIIQEITVEELKEELV